MSFTDFRHSPLRPPPPPTPVNRPAAILSLIVMAAILTGIGWVLAPIILSVWRHLIE